ncbi:MAG TPA: inositol monophosphatase family protein [Chitinophagaceae bacterium]|nr:inositol monophosphatase family protein [Chitinophagaceae bacterium]
MLKETLLHATESGAMILKEYFGGRFEISSKDTLNNLVTEVDKKSEQAIIDSIRRNYPDHFILSEEAGEIPTASEYKWIIDPIDGTVNYAHGIPICAVSIGLEKDGEMILGAVFNPFSEELFFAQKGFGASLNDKRIQVSPLQSMERALLVTGFPYSWQNAENDPVKTFERFVRRGIPVRRLGSAALDLCWVACGRFDGFWEFNLQAWDSAAGMLVVREAGGSVTDFGGNPYSPYQKELLASNGKIHNQMLEALREN